MSSVSDTLRKAADLYEKAIEVLETVSKLTANTVDDKAIVVLKAIHAATNKALAGFEGKLSFKDIDKAIKILVDKIKSNDAIADEALKEKFKK